MPKVVEHPKTNTSKRYTNFYLTMLIISTAMLVLSIPAYLDFGRTFQYFSVAPLYFSLQLINLFILLVSAAGIVLLYKKQQLGIVLTLGSYAAGFLLLFAMFFCADQVVSYTIASMNPADVQASGGRETIASIMTFFYYGALILGALLTPPFMFLWHYAWRKQQAADQKL